MAEDSTPEPTGPVRRMDNIGNLCWRLIGGIGFPDSEELAVPDPTAAVPLYDALMEAGLISPALLLLDLMAQFGAAGIPRPGPQMRDVVVAFRYQAMEVLRPFLFDLSSLCLEVVRQMNPEPETIQEGTAQITTIRFAVDYPVAVGYRIHSPDGRQVMVVAIHSNGDVDGMPISDPEMGMQGGIAGPPNSIYAPLDRPVRNRRW